MGTADTRDDWAIRLLVLRNAYATASAQPANTPTLAYSRVLLEQLIAMLGDSAKTRARQGDV